MMEWLLLAAATNRFEIWPATRLRPILESVTRDLRRPSFAAAFAPLAERLEERLRAGAPLALFTDNHGEIAADVAFLACLQRQYETRVLLIPKQCPVESDVDVLAVERALCRWAPGLRPELVRRGSRIQGNPPHRFSRQLATALTDLRERRGLIIAKGVANFETLAGMQVETLFLLAAKTDRVARRLGVERGSPVGLWKPADCAWGDPRCLVARPAAESPGAP